MHLKVILPLFLILLLALFLRIYNISTNPPELFTDELANSESAISVIETGKDLENELHVYFSDRVEFRPPIYGYQTYPFIKIFGNDPFAVRLPAVINGLITIYLLYLLVLQITKKQFPALFASFCLAVMPWHIHFSRIGFEPAAFLTLLLAGILFMFKAINQHRPELLFLSFIFFALSSYTYFGSPLFAFLFVLLSIILNIKFAIKYKHFLISGLIIYLLIISPIFYLANTQPTFFDRANRINTFKDGIDLNSITTFTSNYFSHLTFNFLFLNGDPNLRHGAQTGVLYFWMLPFILIGLYYITFHLKPNWIKLFFYLWFLIFPLGGAITNDGVPHATRTLIGAPLFAILTGFGFWRFSQFLISKTHSLKVFFLFLSILVLIIISSLIIFTNQYFNYYPYISQSAWQYGHKEVFSKVQKFAPSYQNVCLGNLDYWGTKPLIAHYLKNTKLHISEIINDPVCSQPKTILVAKPTDLIPTQTRLVDEVKDLNGKVIYRIFTID